VLADSFNGNNDPNLFAGSSDLSSISGNGGNDTLWGDPAEAYRAIKRTIASSKSDGTLAAGGGDSAVLGDNASFSPDGKKIAFTSDATNLVSETAGADFVSEVYLKDLRTGTIQLISSTIGGTPFFPGVESDVLFGWDGCCVFRRFHVGRLLASLGENYQDGATAPPVA